MSQLVTPSHKIWPMRATGAEDTLLDLTTAGDFANKPTTGVVDLLKDSVAWTDNSVEVASNTHDLQTNGMEIFMAASAAANKSVGSTMHKQIKTITPFLYIYAPSLFVVYIEFVITSMKASTA